MKSNATRFSHDLTGVMPVPMIDVTTGPLDGGHVNLNIVGYALGSGRLGYPLYPDGGHVQVAVKMSPYYAVRVLLAALEQVEAQSPGIIASVRLSPMEPFLLDPPEYARDRT